VRVPGVRRRIDQEAAESWRCRHSVTARQP
jgi:hypothetical protein